MKNSQHNKDKAQFYRDLVKKLRAPIERKAYKYLKNKEAAEDAAQEVLIKLIARETEFELREKFERGDFKSLNKLSDKITRNHCISGWRKKK